MRRKKIFFVRRLLAYNDRVPSPAVLWLLGFMVLFLIRPWEVLFPTLEPLRLETLGVVVLLVRVAFGPDTRLRLDQPAIPVLAFLLAVFVTSFTSWDPSVSYEKLESVVKMSIFALCVIATLRTPADLRAFCWGWVGIMGVYEFKSLWEYFLHGRGVYRMGFFRLIGIEDSNGDPNTFAGKVVVLLPFLVLLRSTTRVPRERQLINFGFVMSGMVIILTGSRGAMMAAVFLGMLFLAFSKNRVAAFGVLTTAAIVGFLLMPPEIKERYLTLFEPGTNESATVSAEGRWIGFKKGVHLFQERPLLGIGPAIFPVSHEYSEPLPYEVIGLQPHNLPGQLLGEMGLVGVLGFGTLLLSLYHFTWRLHRINPRRGPESFFLSRLGACLAYSTTTLLFYGMAGHNTYSYGWFWLVGLASAAYVVSTGRKARVPTGAAPEPSHAMPSVVSGTTH